MITIICATGQEPSFEVPLECLVFDIYKELARRSPVEYNELHKRYVFYYKDKILDCNRIIRDQIQEHEREPLDIDDFIADCFVEDVHGSVVLEDAYRMFKEWWHANYSGRIPTRKEMKSHCDKKLGTPAHGSTREWSGFQLIKTGGQGHGHVPVHVHVYESINMRLRTKLGLYCPCELIREEFCVVCYEKDTDLVQHNQCRHVCMCHACVKRCHNRCVLCNVEIPSSIRLDDAIVSEDTIVPAYMMMWSGTDVIFPAR